MKKSKLIKETKKINEEIKSLRNKAMITVRDSFLEACGEIFNKYSDLKSFGFKAYTDFWNDGDAVSYHVHCDPEQLSINGEEIYGSELYDQISEEVWDKMANKNIPNSKYNVSVAEMVNEISSFISSFDEDLIKDVFGDHVEVTIGRKGIKIDEYIDHD